MAQFRQHLLAAAGGLLLALPAGLEARKFYADDPLWREPPPVAVRHAHARKINPFFDFFQNTFWEPGRDLRKQHRIPPAADVNTLGEVPDSTWFTNRVGRRPMSVADLARGPGDEHRPAAGPWKILSSKEEGIMPGLVVEDARGQVFYLKFDPPGEPGLSSAADVIGSKIFYDLGYNVPENHIAWFTAGQLVLTPDSKIETHDHERRMDQRDLADILAKCPRDAGGRYRAMASFRVPGKLLGPFRLYDTRADDPNDLVPHERRRTLRGMYVFSAWVNHTDSKSLNTIDTLVTDKGVPYIRHYLLDFGAILGSDSFEPKSERAGFEYLFDWRPAYTSFLTLGLWAPAWQRVSYPRVPGAGHFESANFDPHTWKSNYPNPAFDQRLPEDCFWAAKKVMAFSDEAIRAIVRTGEYADPRAAAYVARTLIERRDKIGRAYFNDVLALDDFAVRGGRLEFRDLAVEFHFASPRAYQVHWSRFDNETELKTPLSGRRSPELPPEIGAAGPGAYYAADIHGADDPARSVTVFLRTTAAQPEVVGVERHNLGQAARQKR